MRRAMMFWMVQLAVSPDYTVAMGLLELGMASPSLNASELFTARSTQNMYVIKRKRMTKDGRTVFDMPVARCSIAPHVTARRDDALLCLLAGRCVQDDAERIEGVMWWCMER
jgi:hypothetical protein